MSAIEVDALAGQICEDIQQFTWSGDFAKEITLGPEPGVILLTFASGAEFTVLVKEG